MKKTLQAFRYAFEGLNELISKERNFKIHVVAALLAVLGGVYFEFTSLRWIILIICIGSVMAAEAFNTAIEILCNHVNPDLHPEIKRVKDISAAAVLLVSISAFITGLILFIPQIAEVIL